MERVIKNVDNIVEISIKNPGIYSMGNASGTGKTYLKQILSYEDDICALTYDSKNVIMTKLREFRGSTKSILYIDRFDTIVDAEICELLDSLKNRYVILDFKNNNHSDLLHAKHIILKWTKGKFMLYA